MTDREAALCDLAYAHGMQAASAMLAQGADQMVRDRIQRLTMDALRVLRQPTRTDVASLVGRHDG